MPQSPSADSTTRPGVLQRLRAGLARTRERLGAGRWGARLDPALREALEDHLLMADVGVETTAWILARLEEVRADTVQAGLRSVLGTLLAPCQAPLDLDRARPFVVLLAGVNGSGKTTTAGKLALHWRAQGRRVLLAAADTFRAAATEQLLAWGARAGCPVIHQRQGADPASVAHDAVQAAAARECDVLLIDTAGRQHSHANLMAELKKIRRVVDKRLPGAPHEVLLVLDGTAGQNALAQLQAFDAALGVTGLCLTKLDGSAKGGVLLAIAHRQPRPVRYIGVGEAPEDLLAFDAEAFVDALLPAA